MKAICLIVLVLGLGFFSGFKISNFGNSDKSTGEESVSNKFLSAKKQLIKKLPPESEFYSLVSSLEIDPSDCLDVEAALLPNFIIDKNKVKICNPQAILRDQRFSDRLAFEFLEVNNICDDPSGESLESICDKKDTNQRYFPNRILASVKKENSGKTGKRSFTVTIDYGDKTSVFMVIDKQSQKLAYKTNYGNEKMVPLDELDIEYMNKQIARIDRKLIKPKCKRKIIRLFAFDKSGQRFRSFACIENLSSHTQKMLKLEV